MLRKVLSSVAGDQSPIMVALLSFTIYVQYSTNILMHQQLLLAVLDVVRFICVST